MKLRISLPFRLRHLSHPPLFRSYVVALIVFATLFPVVAAAQDSQWVRPMKPGDPLVWGRRDGVVFGLFSPGGIKGPRGLIRVGLFTPGTNEPQLLNFIAVEPVIQGPGQRFDRMAFSEMEMSVLDPGLRGKRMWVHPENGDNKNASAGTLKTLHVGDATLERLSVRIDVERFTQNGAHVYVIASIDSDHPSQLRLSTFAENDSPPIEELSLTATMGNYERLRLLWLKDHVVDSRELFANYPWPLHWRLETGDDFAEKENYPLPEMLRTGDGDAIVFCTSSEFDPGKTPGNDSAHWPYMLPKITQYWLVPGHEVQPDLRVRVNARHTYWASTAPVLGGVAFENFEVRQRYVPGQTFIFGITPQEPWVFYHGSSHLTPFEPDKPQTKEVTH
jgi:hypothetical protein